MLLALPDRKIFQLHGPHHRRFQCLLNHQQATLHLHPRPCRRRSCRSVYTLFPFLSALDKYGVSLAVFTTCFDLQFTLKAVPLTTEPTSWAHVIRLNFILLITAHCYHHTSLYKPDVLLRTNRMFFCQRFLSPNY